MPRPSHNSVLSAITHERRRQEELRAAGRFGHTCADVDMPNAEWLAVLGEEFGEVSRAVLEESRLANDVHGLALRTELLHVAAVAVAWLEGMEV